MHGLSTVVGRTLLLAYCLLATPRFGFRLFCPSIDSALIPQRAPALLGGAKSRVLDGGNPDVSTDIANRHFHRLPAHGRIIHKMPRAQITAEFLLLAVFIMPVGQYA